MPSADEAALNYWEAATAAWDRGDRKAALHAYREAARIDPDFGEALLGVGVCLVHAAEWTEAARILSRALQLLPGDSDTEYNLACALDELGRFTESEPLWRRRVAADPNDTEVAYRLGCALAQQSQCREALEVFRRVVRRDGSFHLARAMAAREHIHFGELEEARTQLRAVRSGQPELIETWDELKEHCVRLGV